MIDQLVAWSGPGSLVRLSEQENAQRDMESGEIYPDRQRQDEVEGRSLSNRNNCIDAD